MCECGCVCVIYVSVYVCVARYQWCGFGCVVFLFTTFFLTFHYALFTVHVSCIWLGKFPVCLHDVCCRWFGGGGGRDGD